MSTRFNCCEHGRPGVVCVCRRCMTRYRREHARLRDQLALVIRQSWETLSVADRQRVARIGGLLITIGLILCGQNVCQENYVAFLGDRRLSDVERDLAWLERAAEIG
jgi:hypothetical protein